MQVSALRSLGVAAAADARGVIPEASGISSPRLRGEAGGGRREDDKPGKVNVAYLMCWIAYALAQTHAAFAQAQFPTRPVRIVVPTSAGSAADTLARTLAPPLSERLGQSVVVDIRPGGATVIGTEAVAKAAPDGHTLLIGLPALAINPSIHPKLPYDAVRDFAPITRGTSQPNLLAVHPSLPAKSVKELIALAKSRPGELVFASAGLGAASHLTMELFLMMTGTRMLHVPYKGPTPGVIDLVAGRVSVMASSTVSMLPQVRSGRLRALGVTTPQRVAALPDIPTIAEAGVPGYESVSWFGLVAPAGTPKEVIARLHRESASILRTPEVRDRLARDGTEVVGGTPEGFEAYIRAEIVKWAKVVKAAGIKPE
jgi:tripartite-type tricarboxylate transporter receptor subunit TctC